MIREFLDQMGVHDARDFVFGVFGKTIAVVVVQLVVGLAASFVPFVREWLYDPPAALLLIGLLILADTILGAIIAVRLNREVFSLNKFTRMWPVMLAHFTLMVLSFWLSKTESWLIHLPSFTYFFFATRNLLSVVRNMTRLKLIRAEFLTHLVAFLDSTPSPKPTNLTEDEKPSVPADSDVIA